MFLLASHVFSNEVNYSVWWFKSSYCFAGRRLRLHHNSIQSCAPPNHFNQFTHPKYLKIEIKNLFLILMPSTIRVSAPILLHLNDFHSIPHTRITINSFHFSTLAFLQSASIYLTATHYYNLLNRDHINKIISSHRHWMSPSTPLRPANEQELP